jgi:hypothetical protein
MLYRLVFDFACYNRMFAHINPSKVPRPARRLIFTYFVLTFTNGDMSGKGSNGLSLSAFFLQSQLFVLTRALPAMMKAKSANHGWSVMAR